MARPAVGRFALAPGVRGANAITTSLTFLLNAGSRPVPGQVWGRGMRHGFGLVVASPLNTRTTGYEAPGTASYTRSDPFWTKQPSIHSIISFPRKRSGGTDRVNSKSHSPAPEVADPQSDLLRVESTWRSMSCSLVRQSKEVGCGDSEEDAGSEG